MHERVGFCLKAPLFTLSFRIRSLTLLLAPLPAQKPPAVCIVLLVVWCQKLGGVESGFGLGEVTVDSIREQGVMYYCHTNKEKVKSAKELRCLTWLVVGGGQRSQSAVASTKRSQDGKLSLMCLKKKQEFKRIPL